MKAIVCGGRAYADAATLATVLAGFKVTCVVVGDADGADRLAREWAEAHGIPAIVYRADWRTYGRAAGPMRNQRMLGESPEAVIAFPGGRGTADMVRRARRARVTVLPVNETPGCWGSGDLTR